MVCGFSETESNSYRIWNPKTSHVLESRNVVFIEIPLNLLAATGRLSPQQDLELPSYDFSDDTLDDNYVSHDDMLQDAQTTPSLWISDPRLREFRPEQLHRRDHHLHHRPRLHQNQRLHLLLRHQGQLMDTPITVPWESRPPLRAAEPQAFCLCLSLHVTAEAATTTEQLWRSFLERTHCSVYVS